MSYRVRVGLVVFMSLASRVATAYCDQTISAPQPAEVSERQRETIPSTSPAIVPLDPPVAAQRPPFETETDAVPSVPPVSTSPDEQAEAPPASWTDSYVLLPAASAVFGVIGAFLYDRSKRRVSVSLLARHRPSIVAGLHGLYMQRIEAAERIPPQHLTHCLGDPGNCVTGVKGLQTAAGGHSLTECRHVLIAAKCQGEVVGFLKGLFLPASSVLYIAYSAVDDGEKALERRTMLKMLECLKSLLAQPSAVRWIAFEITNSDAGAVRAKERLFKQYAGMFGVQLRKVGIEYLQPDLDCQDLSSNQELPSHLYLGAVGSAPLSIDLKDLREIIENMFFGIYVPTWCIDRSAADNAAIERYARSVVDLVLTGVPSKVALS